MTEPRFTHNTAQLRYEAALDGELAAFAEYKLSSGTITLTHTEVLPAHEGKGLGSAIARHVLDAARAQQLHVVPACEFMAGYIRKHGAYADLVRPHVQQADKI